MKLRNLKFVFLVLLILLLIVLVLVDKKKKTQSIVENFNLPIGKIISPFLIKDVNGNELDFPYLQTTKISGIFIMPKACLTCNPNFFFLEKLTKTYPTQFSPLWIVPLEYIDFKKYYDPLSTIYPVYIPVHLDAFSREFNLQFKSNPQVTFLKGNRVIYSKTGELDTEDFFTIRKMLTHQKISYNPDVEKNMGEGVR